MRISNFKKINLLAVSFLVSLLVASTASATSFKDNTLLRGKDWQIFVVIAGQREKIKDLAELKRNFRDQEIINVDDKTLAEIKIKTSANRVPSANRGSDGIKPDNSLIRSRDGRIFVTVQGERRQIRDLAELRREHVRQAIQNVDDAALTSFPRVFEDNPDRTFDDNSLIRDKAGKIFVIEDNATAREPISDLNELRQEHPGQAIHDVDDNVINQFELRDRANEPDEDVLDNAAAEDNPARVGDDNLPRHSGVDNAPGGQGEIGSGRSADSSSSSSSSSGGSSGSGGGSHD